MGYGKSSRLHTSNILRRSQDLPLMIELVGEEVKIEGLIEALDPMLGSALVTLKAVRVVRYGHNGGPG